jgi:hypothetical protein
MLGIKVPDNPVPPNETRIAFMEAYAENTAKRIDALRKKPE